MVNNTNIDTIWLQRIELKDKEVFNQSILIKGKKAKDYVYKKNWDHI